MSLLEAKEVTLVRGGRLLLEGFDLTLAPGEAVHLTGPNGVGKSSLLRCIAGLLRPAKGAITHRGVALADDRLALDGERSLAEALGFWCRLDSGDLETALASMGLERLGDVPVRYLSTGQRQRARIARVIASRAPLWLLDEPANGLDAEGRARLAAVIDAHRAAGGAVLAASHVPFAEQMREVAL